jgi:hypothetical protein
MSIRLPRRCNSAGHILEIVNRAQPSTNKFVIDGWAEVFEVSYSVVGLERQHEVCKPLGVTEPAHPPYHHMASDWCSGNATRAGT